MQTWKGENWMDCGGPTSPVAASRLACFTWERVSVGQLGENVAVRDSTACPTPRNLSNESCGVSSTADVSIYSLQNKKISNRGPTSAVAASRSACFTCFGVSFFY